MEYNTYTYEYDDGTITLLVAKSWDGTLPVIDPGGNNNYLKCDVDAPNSAYEYLDVEVNNPTGGSYDACLITGYINDAYYGNRLALQFNHLRNINGSVGTGGGQILFDGTDNYNGTITTYENVTVAPGEVTVPLNLQPGRNGDYTLKIECDFPIFDTLAHRNEYILSNGASQEGLLNGNFEYELEETKDYFIYNEISSVSQLYGDITPSGSAIWRSQRFKANSTPVFYFDSTNSYKLTLSARDVVASKAVSGPGYIIDNIPESGWTESALESTGPYYGNRDGYAKAYGNLPPDGTYTYGITFQTNIPIYKNKSDAMQAIESDDFSDALNAYDLSATYYDPPRVGVEETATSFGSGGVTSPFVKTYALTQAQVLNVANVFYTNDQSILDNIKAGLSLFGASPFEAICGLTYYPFSVSQLVNVSADNYIYFGSYKYESAGLSVNKVLSYKTGAYIDAGTVTLTPVSRSYRNMEPFCNLNVYLPYIGWQKLNIADYLGKTVNIRYYVDIMTRSCIVALVANNVLLDYFTGEIGVNLPITGQNLSEYANSTIRALLGTAGGAIGGAAMGASIGGYLPTPVAAGGAIAGALVGGAAGLGAGVFNMSQKPKPADINKTKGNFSSGSGLYMPQYVIFRFDVHDLIVPDLLTDLYGRPSSASGKLSSFSGFVKADTVKLNTTGMTEREASIASSLLKEGVFV